MSKTETILIAAIISLFGVLGIMGCIAYHIKL